MKICSVVLALALLTSCGVDSDFSESEADRIFGLTTGEMAKIHGDVFGGDQDPVLPYTHDCAGGGTITMEATGEIDPVSGFPPGLLHTLSGCTLNGVVFDGTLDYVDAELGICNGEGFGLDIEGELTIGGELMGDCVVRAREECGEFFGKVCGHDL